MRKHLLCSLLFACWSFLPQIRADVPSFSSPAAFAQEVVLLYGSGAGALSSTDDPYIEDRSDSIVEITNFPQSFLRGLIPTHRNGVISYPITVRLDDESSAAVFYNAEGEPFYLVEPTTGSNPDWHRSIFPDAATNPIHALSHVGITWRVSPPPVPTLPRDTPR